MGMTLPLLTNIFSGAVHDFFRIVSLLCFVNTLGAATGAVVASYVIILLFGLRIAVYVAAAINIGIAVLIFLALRLRDARPVPATGRSGSGPRHRRRQHRDAWIVAAAPELGKEDILPDAISDRTVRRSKLCQL